MIKELIDRELNLLNEKAIAYGHYKQGHISYGKFVLEYMEIEEKSSIECPKEYILDWLIGEKDNPLSITSSGSTLNAILDEDGLINALEGEGVEFVDEILSCRCRDYIMEEIDAIKTNIRCKLRASNSM